MAISYYIPINKKLRYFKFHSLFFNSSPKIIHSPFRKTLILSPQNQTFFSSVRYPSFNFHRYCISTSIRHSSACFKQYPPFKCSHSGSYFNRFYCSDSVHEDRNSGCLANKNADIIAQIIKYAENYNTHLESKLNSMNLSLSISSVTRYLRVLNSLKVPAVAFFHWVRELESDFYSDSDICSLVVCNCGTLDDFDTMLSLMKDFNMNDIQLNKRAFGFLSVGVSSKNSEIDLVKRVIDVLNKAGGSCQGSGIRVLVKWFCFQGNLDMARFVIRNTDDKKVSYYNILMREKCRSRDFKGATDMLHEMNNQVDCDPNVQTYNYVLSVLCKSGKIEDSFEVIKLMHGNGCPPNALSFEILIHELCSTGKLNTALEVLDKMASYDTGIVPRLSTHAIIIKGYFNSEQYEEAYDYLVASSDKYKSSSNSMFSLLASLYRKKGNMDGAYSILHKMSEKGLRPHFPVYISVLRDLQKSESGILAGDLKTMFSGMCLQSN